MYGELAWTWPIVSPPDRYVSEANEFIQILLAHAAFEPRTLLHLGSGGGHLDRTLKARFAITGVDDSPPMLALARALNPEVEYVEGDMRTLRLGRTFDAAIVADSISYMETEGDLRAALRTAWEHVRPGGAFATYAETTAENFREGATDVTGGRRGDAEITLVEHRHDPDPADTSFEATFVYVIRRAGRLEVEVDVHTFGLFELATWRRLLRETGFEVSETCLPAERPGEEPVRTFACVRPAVRRQNL